MKVIIDFGNWDMNVIENMLIVEDISDRIYNCIEKQTSGVQVVNQKGEPVYKIIIKRDKEKVVR